MYINWWACQRVTGSGRRRPAARRPSARGSATLALVHRHRRSVSSQGFGCHPPRRNARVGAGLVSCALGQVRQSRRWIPTGRGASAPPRTATDKTGNGSGWNAIGSPAWGTGCASPPHCQTSPSCPFRVTVDTEHRGYRGYAPPRRPPAFARCRTRQLVSPPTRSCGHNTGGGSQLAGSPAGWNCSSRPMRRIGKTPDELTSWKLGATPAEVDPPAPAARRPGFACPGVAEGYGFVPRPRGVGQVTPA